ncbi:MAG TPA: hypothetical protein VLB69_00420 [Rudaea sp.]|nr:hypothetical protein [Rudaea sp.]
MIIALCVGFFVTLLLAWYHGDRGAQKVTGTELLILALLLAIGGGLMWRFTPGVPAPAAAGVQAPHAGAAKAANAQPMSIAVLPFVNMSADAENEFFSDGLSEEILNSLARIDGMQVVGRTSSFQFKGKNQDLRAIGDTLGVAAVLEGSVRREGPRARITAQLIRASDGIHLWSQTYDRTVEDTLAVQLDIAEQVAGALNVVLDDGQRTRMRAAGIKNVDAFIAYQKGLKVYADAHAKPELDLFDTLGEANQLFAKATQLEPNFSLAYFAMADRFEHLLQADDRSAAVRLDAQQSALKTLQQAAASSADEQQTLITLAERQMLSDDWRGLSERIDAAFRQPGCNVSNWLPVFASAFGYGDEIEAFGVRASTCNPLDAINFSTRVTAAVASGQGQRALSILAVIEKTASGTPARRPEKALALALLGRMDDAAKVLDPLPLMAQNENGYRALLIIGRARGDVPAAIHARLQSFDRTRSKYKRWQLVELIEASIAGDRSEANRRATAIDARPGGPFVLALVAADCLCGAPFDLDATPNFKARLAESGLHWPPAQAMKFPPPANAPAR